MKFITEEEEVFWQSVFTTALHGHPEKGITWLSQFADSAVEELRERSTLLEEGRGEDDFPKIGARPS